MTEITLKRQNTSQLQFLCKQQEAVEWMEALLGSKVDPDLSTSLRDGTLLYSIMTKIKEGSMAKKPLKTSVPFKMSENAQQFINAAKAYGCTVVFLPGDLVNTTNMMNVLACLQNLAEVAHRKGEAPKWPGADDAPPAVVAPEKKIKKFGSAKLGHLKQEKEVRSQKSASVMTRVDQEKLRALLGEDDDVDIRLMAQSFQKDEPSNENAGEKKPVEQKVEHKPTETKPEDKTEQKSTEHKATEHKHEEKTEQKPAESKPQETKPAEQKPAQQKTEHKPVEVKTETKAAEHKAAEHKHEEKAEHKPVESKPHVEHKPQETKPAEEKPAEQAPAEKQKPVEQEKPVEEKKPESSESPKPVLAVQQTPPGSPAMLSEDEKRQKAEKAERLRLRVIQEIISTERDYVRDLEKTVELFATPLRSFDFMEAGSVNAIFSNIEMIIQVNKQLLKKLDERLEDSSPKYWIVGDIFLDMADYLKMYTVYCSNQEQSLSTLDRYSKENEEFQSWIKEVHKNVALNGLTLRDYLVKPVQRICRYPLLLRELLKNTHDLHVDYDKLVAALAKMETLASYVNEAKRHEENLNKVLEIQRVVQGCDNLISPTRKFIREGDLIVMEKGKPKPYRGWLFTDMLMYAKTQRNISFSTKKGFYVYKDRIGFSDCIITEWPDSKDIKNAFQLQSISRATKFVIGCATKEEKDVWMEDITKCTEALMQMDAAKKRLSLPTRSRGNSGADSGTPKRSSLNSVQAELLKEYAEENAQEESNNGEATASPKLRGSATENFNSLSKSTGAEALSQSSEDDGSKTRNWKKASQMSALDVMKELEEEKKKRVELEEAHKLNEAEIKNLQTQLKQAQDSLDYEKKRREEQKKELEDVKERLVNSTMELMQMKDTQATGSPSDSKAPQRPASVNNIPAQRRGSQNEATQSDSPAPLRSWNKKVIYDVQEISRQLNNEKKARRELEEWKKEHEEKMEEMKKKVRTETDARIKMEEQHKKLQRELEELRAAYANATK